MGGRGSGGAGNKYLGRFSTATDEQLSRARRNLTTAIAREENSLLPGTTYVGGGREFHQEQLEALRGQLSELNREEKRRKRK